MPREDDFCMIHGKDWMRSQFDNPIPYCAACEGEIDLDDDVSDDDFKCPTCKGTGTVNPLTAPEDFFCVSTTDCPHCDGSGEI